jgi:Transglycosylase SLT domain
MKADITTYRSPRSLSAIITAVVWLALAVVAARSGVLFGFSSNPGHSPQPTSELLERAPVATVALVRTRCPRGTPAHALADSVHKAALTTGIAESFLVAVMVAESSCRTEAISPVGARGLMQLMPSTARYVAGRYGIELASEQELTTNVTKNVLLGALYLRDLKGKFGTDHSTLLAYNWGPGNVASRGGHQAPASSKQYAQKVIALSSRDDLTAVLSARG